jgi:hypothetical protein
MNLKYIVNHKYTMNHKCIKNSTNLILKTQLKSINKQLYKKLNTKQFKLIPENLTKGQSQNT